MDQTQYEKEARGYRTHFAFLLASCVLFFAFSVVGIGVFAWLADDDMGPFLMSNVCTVLACYFFLESKSALKEVERWTDILAVQKIVRKTGGF